MASLTIISCAGDIGHGDSTDNDDATTVVERYINMEEATSTGQYNKIAGIVDVGISDEQTIRVGITEDYLNVNYTKLETDAGLSVEENDNDEGINIQSIVDSLAEAKEEIQRELEDKALEEAKNRLDKRNYTLSKTQGGLVDIADPDPNYTGTAVRITGYDRRLLELLVMGEAGAEGFEGAAMVAQCIRDMYLLGNYSSIDHLRVSCKYSGGLTTEPSQAVLDAVSFIFDQGGYAVKHRILYFYAPRYSTGKWHNTQNFILEYGGHRFFDRWN